MIDNTRLCSDTAVREIILDLDNQHHFIIEELDNEHMFIDSSMLEFVQEQVGRVLEVNVFRQKNT